MMGPKKSSVLLMLQNLGVLLIVIKPNEGICIEKKEMGKSDRERMEERKQTTSEGKRSRIRDRHMIEMSIGMQMRTRRGKEIK